MPAGATLNPEKCEFSQKTVKFLGHIIDENGIRADLVKTSAIRETKPPNNIPELRRMVNQLVKFLENLATLTQPLRKLLRTPKTTNNTHSPGRVTAHANTPRYYLVETPAGRVTAHANTPRYYLVETPAGRVTAHANTPRYYLVETPAGRVTAHANTPRYYLVETPAGRVAAHANTPRYYLVETPAGRVAAHANTPRYYLVETPAGRVAAHANTTIW